MLVKRIRGKFFFELCSRYNSEMDSRLQARFPKYFKRAAKGKDQYIKKANEERKIMFDELIFSHCGGDPVKIRELKRFDIMDFFSFLENNENKMKNG
jgi:hypothetical protein